MGWDEYGGGEQQFSVQAGIHSTIIRCLQMNRGLCGASQHNYSAVSYHAHTSTATSTVCVCNWLCCMKYSRPPVMYVSHFLTLCIASSHIWWNINSCRASHSLLRLFSNSLRLFLVLILLMMCAISSHFFLSLASSTASTISFSRCERIANVQCCLLFGSTLFLLK